jgi:hypothetical protein
MARPLASDHNRGGKTGRPAGGLPNGTGALHELILEELEKKPEAPPATDLEQLQAENQQLRTLCAELEQALQEAAGHTPSPEVANQIKELELLVEEKSEVIRDLHQKVHELEAALAEAVTPEAPVEPPPRQHQGPVPREEELLTLSEELERERRQLQEDEQTLMDQMRQMEVSMARERAEMARGRSELLRLQAEIHHELERLERNGALQTKMDNLKNRLTDVSARRGAAPVPQPTAAKPPAPDPAPAPARKDGLMSRWFGQGR